MGSNPNTISIKKVYSNDYQLSHYTRTTFRAFATERYGKNLQEGDTFYISYTNDFLANDMGGDGSYATQAIVDTQQSLVVNLKKEVSFQIPKWQTLQFNTPVVKKRSRKAANRMWLTIDADGLGQLAQNAGNYLDAQYFGGTAGTPITPSTGNILAMFTTAKEVLESQNVEYVPGMGDPEMEMEGQDLVLAAAISPRAYNMINQFVAGKNSSLGDKATMRSYRGSFMEFNLFVTNNLPWETWVYMSVNPTDGDTLTIGGVLFTFKTTATVTTGYVQIASTAALTITNLVAALNAPYTNISQATNTGYVAYVQANLTFAQQYMFMNAGGTTPQLVASQITAAGAPSASGTYLKIYVIGQSVVSISASFTSATNVISFQQQHCLFGTSRSIDYIIQRRPNLHEQPVSGKVATDYINWNLWGRAVFQEQVPQMVDVRISTVGQIAPAIAWN